jgi:NitT/TauT family transport system permease protein
VNKALKIAPPIICLLLFWAALAAFLGPNLLPGPAAVGVQLVHSLQDRAFLTDFWASFVRAASGLGLAFIIPFPFGLLLGACRRLDAFVAPILYLTYPIPKILMLPVLLVLLGLGEAPKILIVAVTAGYQVLVVTRDNVMNLDRRHLDSFNSLWPRNRSAGGRIKRRLLLVRHVLAPSALPAAATAFRLSSGTAVAVLFMAESFATRQGLGQAIMDAWGLLDLPRMFVGIIGLGLLGAFFYFLSNWAEKRVCRWKDL